MKLFGWTISRDVQDGIRIVGDLQRVSFEYGDVLMFTTPRRLSKDQIKFFKEYFKRHWKDRIITTVALGDGMTAAVLGVEKPKAP